MPYNIDKRGKSLTIITVYECYSYLYITFILSISCLYITSLFFYRMFYLSEKKRLSLQLNAKGGAFAQL